MHSFRHLFRPLVVRRFLMMSKSSSLSIEGRRFLLSPAYNCVAAWEAQRKSPALKDLDPNDFLAELQRQLQRGNPISAVDLDVLMNCIADSEQFDEAINVLYKFRHGSNAANMLPSTHWAFLRSCLHYGKDETLMRVLDDPINYGVFLDPHNANTLMNHFIKNGNHRDAAKVASKIMLQEDFDNKLTCWLAVLSCLKWIKEPVPDAAPAEDPAGGQGDDDEIIMRLPFLKNPHYDDHFDISDLSALFGKTLAWTARHLDSKEMSLNLIALGYGLKKDYENAVASLRQQLSMRVKLYEEVAQYLLGTNKETATGGEENSEEKPGEASKDPTTTEPDAGLDEIKSIVDQFRKSDLIIQEDLEESFLEELKKILPELESGDIKARTADLEEWNKRRQKRIENQVLRYLKLERLKEIDKAREEMKEVEEYLNFFENRTKLEISVHPELLKQEEEARQREQAEQQQLPSDDKYVIPELRSRKEEEKIQF